MSASGFVSKYQGVLFASRSDITLPLHLQTWTPATVVTLKSSPVSEKTFSFICSVCSVGWKNCGRGPRGGSKGARGAIVEDSDRKWNGNALNEDVNIEESKNRREYSVG